MSAVTAVTYYDGNSAFFSAQPLSLKCSYHYFKFK